LKLIADCSKLLTSLGIEYVGFRFGDVPLNKGTFFTWTVPTAFG